MKPDHLIFFPSCSSSMKRIHLVWLNVSEMCLTPKLLAVIQASFLQPWMTSEFKMLSFSGGKFHGQESNSSQFSLGRQASLQVCFSPSVLLRPSSTTNTHIHTPPGTYHSFPRVFTRELDYLAQWRVNRSNTNVMHSTKTSQCWFIFALTWMC